MQKQNFKTNIEGFTLIELLVTVAIISLLVAIALPQYGNFIIRAKRTEVVLTLNAAHKTQAAYFANVDHYFRVCASPSCIDTDAGVYQTLKEQGLDDEVLNHSGYDYEWHYPLADNTEYELSLEKDVDTSDWDRDLILIGVSSNMTAACGTAGYSDGVPFMREDDLTNEPHC